MKENKSLNKISEQIPKNIQDEIIKGKYAIYPDNRYKSGFIVMDLNTKKRVY